MRKRCAVCGDTTKLNVRYGWRRDRDGKTVNVCVACREVGRINENSIDNFTTKDTIYIKESFKSERKEVLTPHFKRPSKPCKRIGRVKAIVVDSTAFHVEKVSVKDGAPNEVIELINNFNNANGNLMIEVTPCGGDTIDMAIQLGDYEVEFPHENEYSEALKEVIEWVWIENSNLTEIK